MSFFLQKKKQSYRSRPFCKMDLDLLNCFGRINFVPSLKKYGITYFKGHKIIKCFPFAFKFLYLYTEVGWLVGCFGFNGPLRQYFSLYWVVSQREGKREERIP